MSDPDTPPADSLRAFLATRDAPCPCCNYNLRALPGSRCPECNQELILHVGLAQPKLAWFITGLIGIGMNLGFCALILGWVLVMILSRNRPAPPGATLVPLAIGAPFAALVLIAWIRYRSTLAPKDGSLRWTLALVATALCFLFPLWFFAIAK